MLGKKDEKERSLAGIFPARLGPMLVNYVQNPLAISKGSVTVLPSTLKDEGREGFAFPLLIINGSFEASNKILVMKKAWRLLCCVVR